MKRILKKFLGFFRSFSDIEKLTVVKRSDTKFFRGMRRAIYESYAGKDKEFEDELNRRVAELQERLSGDIRETSFRHEFKLLDAGEVFLGVSSPRRAAQMLCSICRFLKPDWAIEIGSAFGIGSFAITFAMRSRKDSQFDGFEFEEWRARIAEESAAYHLVERAKIHSGPAEENFPRIAAKNGRFDFAFVDAVHTYEATRGYHEMLMHYAKAGSVIVYDDINWSDGMMAFWDELIKDDRLSEIYKVGVRWGIVRVG